MTRFRADDSQSVAGDRLAIDTMALPEPPAYVQPPDRDRVTR
jgi:hypothetical protein